MELNAQPARSVPPSGSITGRLSRYVDRNGGPKACWPWLAYRNRDGYGTLQVDRKSKMAHRLAWEAAQGPIPNGMFVLHHCDNPSCCNPAHLWLGTLADNNRDRDRKGRGADRRGERAGGAKLTESDVLAIRAAAGTRGAIAMRFGISLSAVTYIRQGKRWGHVGIRPAAAERDSGQEPDRNSARALSEVLS